MQFLQLKSCSQDLRHCCCFCRRNMRFNSCTAETHLFLPRYKSVLTTYTTTRIVLLVHIAICHRTLSETESQGSPVFHISLRVLDSFDILPYQKYQLFSFPTERPLVEVFQSRIKFFFHWKPHYKEKRETENRYRLTRIVGLGQWRTFGPRRT